MARETTYERAMSRSRLPYSRLPYVRVRYRKFSEKNFRGILKLREIREIFRYIFRKVKGES